MSRIRTIKPEFWTSEQVVECSPTARLLFIGMWNFADDNGLIPAAIKTLRMKVLPGDGFSETEIENWLQELEDQDLIRRYAVEGKEYFWITGWKNHQRIDKPTDKHPYPDFADFSPMTRGGLGDDSLRKGREGKGREGTDRRFEEWWSIYPKKVKKKPTHDLWVRRELDAIADTLIADTQARMKKDDRWKRGFVPDPTTYINQERWTDEASGIAQIPQQQKNAIPENHGKPDWRRMGETQLLEAGTRYGLDVNTNGAQSLREMQDRYAEAYEARNVA